MRQIVTDYPNSFTVIVTGKVVAKCFNVLFFLSSCRHFLTFNISILLKHRVYQDLVHDARVRAWTNAVALNSLSESDKAAAEAVGDLNISILTFT